MQWLSQTPGAIPDQVQVALSRDQSTKEAFHRQAADDWRRFLVARGRELRPGGQLVVLTMAALEDGEFGYRVLLDNVFDRIARLEPHTKDTWLAVLTDGAKIPVSRAGYTRFNSLIVG